MAGMLGDILIDRGQLTEAQLNTALKTKHPGQMLGDRLLAMGVVSSAQLGSALAEQFEVPFIDVEPQAVDSQIVVSFATSASCLVHSNQGDFNYSTRQDVENVMYGSGSARVVR